MTVVAIRAGCSKPIIATASAAHKRPSVQCAATDGLAEPRTGNVRNMMAGQGGQMSDGHLAYQELVQPIVGIFAAMRLHQMLQKPVILWWRMSPFSKTYPNRTSLSGVRLTLHRQKFHGRVATAVSASTSTPVCLLPRTAGEVRQVQCRVQIAIDLPAARLTRMQYQDFRAAGLPIGSGVVESGAKQTKHRVSAAGMRWSRTGLENMLPLRAAVMSGTFDSLWARICPF